jgi:gluconokinase
MVILVMGTTGSGKTTVGKLLAARLGWAFLDADDFHPRANIRKMKAGIPLTDADRAPWLESIHLKLLALASEGRDAVLACSALKESYRRTLAAGLEFRTVYLRGTYEEMRRHILARRGHFAGEGILAGQFADLEEPREALVVDVARTPDELVEDALQGLGLRS